MVFLVIGGLVAAYIGLQRHAAKLRRGEYARMKSKLAPKGDHGFRVIKGGK